MSNSNDIIWAFQSSRVELGIGRLVAPELSEKFTQYVRVAMRREISRNGLKTVEGEKSKTAKEFKDTQKTDSKGSRYTTGHKEQWLLDKCGEWCRQLSATDQAFAGLQKAGMLGTEFCHIGNSALGNHLEWLKGQFLTQHAPAAAVQA
jgi:hypothetical protein